MLLNLFFWYVTSGLNVSSNYFLNVVKVYLILPPGRAKFLGISSPVGRYYDGTDFVGHLVLIFS